MQSNHSTENQILKAAINLMSLALLIFMFGKSNKKSNYKLIEQMLKEKLLE